MSNNKNCSCPEYKDKYDDMGVSPEELYLRQQGLCYLTLVIDNIDGVDVPGDLYCTDGKDYALTKSMLNPTVECMECISGHLLKREVEHMAHIKEVNKTILNLLKAVSKEESVSLNRSTLDKLDDFFSVIALSSKETQPLRVCTDGNLYLFGKVVIVDEKIKDGHALLKPSNLEIWLNL